MTNVYFLRYSAIVWSLQLSSVSEQCNDYSDIVAEWNLLHFG
jgi:hypothetical protein